MSIEKGKRAKADSERARECDKENAPNSRLIIMSFYSFISNGFFSIRQKKKKSIGF